MRKTILVAALGFALGAAGLAVGEDDPELPGQLERLQEAVARLRATGPVPPDRPPLTETGHEMAIFPIFDLTAGRRDFVPPLAGLSIDPDDERPFFGGVGREAVQPVGTAEEILEMVRSSVLPRAWEQGMLAAPGQTLLVIQSRAVIDAVGTFLDERLRAQAHACVAIEAEFVDVAPALARELTSATGTALPERARETLDKALASGQATRVFSGRATCFAGQQCVLRHGRQVAVSSEAEVKIAQEVSSADPRVEIVQAGGVLAVRPSLGDDPSRVTLDVDLRFSDLERLETRDTGAAGEVDLPRVGTAGGATALTVPARSWALVGAGTPRGGTVRVALVRAARLPRGGER